ncbi:MAG: hypothetical protein IBX70_06385 [Clostridia bacterium]|nr:hypothetical protein [Clostridia bacterium]
MKGKDIGVLVSKRLALIDQLEKGKLTKESFINENYRMLETYGKVSFDMDTVDEGVLKYHYFNTMAKKLMLEADAIEYREPSKYFQLKNQAYDYYVKKDRITLKLLDLVDCTAVRAYYINMNSRQLEGAIYEIDFIDYDRVILHSKDRKILHKLRSSGCFLEEKLESKVKAYVNTKVY